MTFANPHSLWLLAPLAAVIVALYLLRIRRRELRVPATFLWPSRTEEIRANSLMQRLRFSWLLVLQLLAVTVLVLAFARPQTEQPGLGGRVVVYVLDASASMGATDVSPSRFEAALREVESEIRGARPGDRLALIEAGPSPRVVFALSHDSSRQLQALATARLYDAPSTPGPALRLAAALIQGEEDARIILLSDGAFPPIEDFGSDPSRVIFRRFGESGRNVGIESLGVTRTFEGLAAYCGVRNFGGESVEGTLTIRIDGEVFDSRRFVVPARETYGWNGLLPAGVERVEAFVRADDHLAADNFAVTLVDPTASLRVLLVGSPNPFLESALLLDPRVTLDRATILPTSERLGSRGASAYDVVVFDGVPEEAVKARGVLAFGRAGSVSPVAIEGTVQNPQVIGLADSPLVEGVDLRSVYIERSERVVPAADSRVIAEARDAPILVSRDGARRQIYVAFRALDSDFPLQVGFPIFVANALDFLASTATANLLTVSAGTTLRLPVESDTADLTSPDGAVLRLAAEDGLVRLRSLYQVGEYRLQAGDQDVTLFATLRDPEESDILPRQEIALGRDTVAAIAHASRYADFWRWMVLAALMVLLGEWWLYARRS